MPCIPAHAKWRGHVCHLPDMAGAREIGRRSGQRDLEALVLEALVLEALVNN
jgi:hypothetical protein